LFREQVLSLLLFYLRTSVGLFRIAMSLDLQSFASPPAKRGRPRLVRCEYASGEEAIPPTPVPEGCTATAQVLIDQIQGQRRARSASEDGSEPFDESKIPVLLDRQNEHVGADVPLKTLVDCESDEDSVTLTVLILQQHYMDKFHVEDHGNVIACAAGPSALAISTYRGNVCTYRCATREQDLLDPHYGRMTGTIFIGSVSQLVWVTPNEILALTLSGYVVRIYNLGVDGVRTSSTCILKGVSKLLTLRRGGNTVVAYAVEDGVVLCCHVRDDSIVTGRWSASSKDALATVHQCAVDVDHRQVHAAKVLPDARSVAVLTPVAAPEFVWRATFQISSIASIPTKPGNWLVAGDGMRLWWIRHNVSKNRVDTVACMSIGIIDATWRTEVVRFLTPTILAVSMVPIEEVVLFYKFDPDAKSLDHFYFHIGHCVGTDLATQRVFVMEENNLTVLKYSRRSKIATKGFVV
jgi:hypothetical protein